MQKKMNNYFRWVGLCVGILSLIYFSNSVLRNISTFPSIQWSFTACLSFAGATLIYAFVILIGGYAWGLLLRALGETVKQSEIIVIFALAQIAKYIPGNIAHQVGRIAIAYSKGYRSSRVSITIAIEAVILIFTSSILAIICVFYDNDILFDYFFKNTSAFKFLPAIILTVIFTFLGGCGMLLILRPNLIKKKSWIAFPSLIVFIKCLLIYFIGFILMGMASNILAIGLLGANESYLFLLTGIFAIAWVAGFIIPGAPAGLGVREVIMLKALEPVYGMGIATGLVVFLRAATTFADGFSFSIAYIFKQKKW